MTVEGKMAYTDIQEKPKKITCLQFFSSHENPSCTDESWTDETCLLINSVGAMWLLVAITNFTASVHISIMMNTLVTRLGLNFIITEMPII